MNNTDPQILEVVKSSIKIKTKKTGCKHITVTLPKITNEKILKLPTGVWAVYVQRNNKYITADFSTETRETRKQ